MGRRACPTLLIFTLGADADCRRRPLLPYRHRTAEVGLRRTCLDAVLAAGRESGCALWVCTSKPLDLPADVRLLPQTGSSFGGRFRNALRRALAESSGPVVVVGTDVPGLGAAQISRALQSLEQDPGRVVLGPCPDGGFYLLATARPLEEALAGVSWCSSMALRDLLSALAADGRSVELLTSLSDLDRRSDLEWWLAKRVALAATWQPILARLRLLLALLRRPPSPIHLGEVRPPFAIPPSGRSPPVPA